MSELLPHVYSLHEAFRRGRRLTINDMAGRLECSRRTVIRVKKFMIDRLGAPIAHDSARRRFFYDGRGESYELPGLWLTAEELCALAVLTHTVDSLDPGLLQGRLEAARARVTASLRHEGIETDALVERIRILSQHGRSAPPQTFSTLAEALLRKRRVLLTYETTGSEAREISPQQLVRYRDCWYLDAYCHTREELRTFALPRVRSAQMRPTRAKTIPKRTLAEHFREAYGLFSGPAKNTAELIFTGHAARYVAAESWHPKQQGEWVSETEYRLRVPYGDARELVGDILRWGPHAEARQPAALRREVTKALKLARKQYYV